jgi:hypothetical protein
VRDLEGDTPKDPSHFELTLEVSIDRYDAMLWHVLTAADDMGRNPEQGGIGL